MLETLRKSSNSKYILFVFGAIILVFIFWGVGPTDSDKGDESAVAKVDGKAVTAREYRELLKRQTEYYKDLFRGQFNEDAAKRLDLKHRSVNALINRALALKAAKSEGIKAGEKEVQDAIMAIPAFANREGVFDRDVYFRTLSSNRVKPAEFEKEMEADIIAGKMRERVVKDIGVTDEDIRRAFLREQRRYNLSYIALDPKSFEPSVKVDDAEAKAFFEKNSSDFIVPVKIKAFYAFAGFKELSKGVKIGSDEVREYYNINKRRFDVPEKAKARHILVRPDDKNPDKESAKKEAGQRAAGLLMRVKGGESFSALAKKYSQDPGSAKAGGDLGWFPKGVMVPAFEDAVFALKKGEISGVVETQFGYHIILLEDKKEAGVQPLKDADAGIREALSKDKAYLAARNAAADLEKEFRGTETVEGLKKAAAKKDGLRYAATGLVTEADIKEELVKDEKTRFALFSLKAGEVSAPIETDKGVYLIKAVERQEARVPEFSSVASRVREKIREAKAGEEAGKKADELLKRASGGEDFDSLAKGAKGKVEETGFFTRAQGFAPKIGMFMGDKEKMFELNEKSPYYPAALRHNDKFYVFRLKAVQEADEKALAEVMEGMRARLLGEKQEEAVNKWLTELRSKAKIKVFEDRL